MASPVTIAPEFSRPIKLDLLGNAPRSETIEASVSECAALAQRFDWLALERLSATASLTRSGDVISATGRVTGAVILRCAATGEPVPAEVDEPFALKLVPDPGHAPDTEIEIDADEADTLHHDGQAIDLGELAAETLALALPAFPRAAGADAVLRAAGVTSDDAHPTGPFAALQALRKP